MFKRLAALLLLAACASQAPAPQPQPATAAPSVVRYTLGGHMEQSSDCPTGIPAEIHMVVTLANAEHTLTTKPRRMGLFGRNYEMIAEWPAAWGKPTVWRDLVVMRLDGSPLCQGSCADGNACTGGASTVNEPVTGDIVMHDITLHCGCSH
jgi:hypothetical protein